MAKNYKGCNKPNYVYGYKAKLEYYLREYKTALDNGDLHSMDEYRKLYSGIIPEYIRELRSQESLKKSSP